eukprot:m.247533 g.247533  ORF g.247533 m.247533 type:complete len:550 (+) comp15422_c0_seq1:9-1658(+)
MVWTLSRAASAAAAMYASRTGGLHWTVLAMYFFVAFLQAFPMTAVGSWLQNDLNMSPAQQSNFYASIFVPYTLKPLYGWISERLPVRGLRRKPYILIGSLITAATWFINAWLVHTPLPAFGIMIAQSVAGAFVDLMLGLMVLDLACKDLVRAGALQSSTETVQSFASLLALLVGLPLYPCSGQNSPLDPWLVFVITGIIACVPIAVACFLPEAPRSPPQSQSSPRINQGAEESGVSEENEDSDSPPVDDASIPLLQSSVSPYRSDHHVQESLPRLRAAEAPTRFPALELVMPALLLLMVWSSVKSFMSHGRWLDFLCVVVVINVALLIFILHRSRLTSTSLVRALQQLKIAWTAIVIFLVNATPTSEDALSSYQYTVWWSQPCYPQYLSIVSEATALLMGCLYFAVFHNWSGRRLIALFVTSGLASAATQLLWVPWVNGNSASQFDYAVLVTVISEAASQCFLIAILVLATQACPLDRGAFAYVLYVSLLDIGDSVSGWITAPITDALSITLEDYSNLDRLIYIGAGSLAGVLVFAAVLLFSRVYPKQV